MPESNATTTKQQRHGKHAPERFEAALDFKRCGQDHRVHTVMLLYLLQENMENAATVHKLSTIATPLGPQRIPLSIFTLHQPK